MTLDAEMQGIFDRADELTQDLMREYKACAEAEKEHVPERARNLFHEVLVKLRAMERKYNAQFREVFDVIRELMAPAKEPRPQRIGFRQTEPK